MSDDQTLAALLIDFDKRDALEYFYPEFEAPPNLLPEPDLEGDEEGEGEEDGEEDGEEEGEEEGEVEGEKDEKGAEAAAAAGLLML